MSTEKVREKQRLRKVSKQFTVKCPKCSFDMAHVKTRLRISKAAFSAQNTNYGSRYFKDRRPMAAFFTKTIMKPVIGSYFECMDCHLTVMTNVIPEYEDPRHPVQREIEQKKMAPVIAESPSEKLKDKRSWLKKMTDKLLGKKSVEAFLSENK